MRAALLAVALLACAAPALAQVRNPTAAEFQSQDHNNTEVTGYEIVIWTCADTACATRTQLQTIPIAKSAIVPIPNTSPQEYRATLQVQPIAFGRYIAFIRVMAGTLASDFSLPSEVWLRGPGSPSKPVVK